MTMSLWFHALLLATLATITTVSLAQPQVPTAEDCPHVEVLRGRDGRDGRDGLNGAKGEQGPVGPSGHKGDKGIPGIQGPFGISGPRGGAGEKGQRGQPGLLGEKGQRGMNGEKGENGQDGQQGPPGEKGQQGLHGEKGQQGLRGVKGDPGLQGPQGEQGVQGPPSGGATYTRWGKTNCSTDLGTELVYAGRAGGTHYRNRGGAVNYLCLPDDPDHLQYQSGVQGLNYVVGVQYDSHPSLSSLTYHNVPCAVCYVANRSVSLMIPGKIQCPTLWTLEYIGYLMAGYYSRYNHKMYECVDKDPESVPGLNSTSDPTAFFHPVEPHCNSLSCPPYDAEKELTCAVCTR